MKTRRALAGNKAEQVLDLLFPVCCADCGYPGGAFLCAACFRRAARKCADFPLAGGSGSGSLFYSEVSFSSFLAAGPYQGPLRDMVLRFKHFERRLARPLALLMLAAAGNDPAYINPDLVTWVPALPGRLKERGYNPPQVLARFISRYLGRPLSGCLAREGRQIDRAGLSGPERWKSTEGAYRARPGAPVKGPVLLVDDVITTGATADACAAALLGSGASRVSVLAAAGPGDYRLTPRTVFPGEER